MKRPLVPVASIYAAGILLGEFLPGPVAWLFAVTAGAIVSALFFNDARGRLLIAALFLFGWTHHSLHQAVLSPVDLRRLVGDQPELVTLRGRILRAPEVRRREDPAGDTAGSVRSQVVVLVDAMGRRGGWELASGTVVTSLSGTLGADYYAGRRVEVDGVVQRPPGPSAEGLFDYRAFLAREGVYFQLRSGGQRDWRLLDAERPPPRPFADRFIQWASATLAYDLPVEPISDPSGVKDEPLELLRAMTLGWKTGLTDTVSEPFMRTGTMHVFAISGLHIALIVGILVNLLRALRLQRGACGAVVIPLIWFYTAATGWQPSALRSTLMMTIVLAGWSLSRPLDLVNSLAGAALILLVWNPAQLFQAGFQLSFCVVLAIALLVPPIESWLHARVAPDPLIPEALVPRWRRWADRPVRWILTSVATSLAAWCGSVALIACYFHLLTPVSLLANLVIVPLSGLALMSNLGALCCGSWLPWLTALFNHGGWFWMKCMMALSEMAAALPGAWFHVRAPSALELVLIHGALAFAWWVKGMTRRWRALGAGALLILGVVWLGVTMRRERHVVLTVLPAGSGAAIWCDAPGRTQDLLADCGSRSAAEFVVKPFLQAQGVNAIPHVVLTHGDQRHVGGFGILESAFSIREVEVSTARFRSRVYREIVEGMETRGSTVRVLSRNETVCGWTVLHPEAGDRVVQADDRPLVLASEVQGVRVLLLSDLGKLGQRELLAREPDLRGDIVVAGMPAQSEPLQETLLDRCRPRVIILTTGDFPAAERPRPALLVRLGARGAVVFSTVEDGAVTVRMGPRGVEVEAMNGRRHWLWKGLDFPGLERLASPQDRIKPLHP